MVAGGRSRPSWITLALHMLRRAHLTLVLIAALTAFACHRGPGVTPAGQPALAMVGDLALFTAVFDAAADRPRLVLMLSPT